jgi:hypothetical protein
MMTDQCIDRGGLFQQQTPTLILQVGMYFLPRLAKLSFLELTFSYFHFTGLLELAPESVEQKNCGL